jgi:mannose-1-phosphate guanylyltransferase/mannose-6-phosphate isomerase
MQALKEFNLGIFDSVFKAWEIRTHEKKFIRSNKEEFLKIPAESIDYAVIEHCPRGSMPINMIQLDAGWSDLGTWDSVWKSLPTDSNGNAYQGDVIILDSKNTLVQATSSLVRLLGVEEY